MRKHLVISLLGLLCCICAASQEPSYSGYFTKSANYTHLLNPAFAPRTGYVNIPVLGNLNIDFKSNILLKNFLFPSSDGSVLYTAFNQAVDADEFLSGIQDKNYMDVDFRTSFLSAGYFFDKNFFSLDIGVSVNAGANLPKDFFAFVKKGMVGGEPTSYTIENMAVQAFSYAYLSFGWSRNILDNLRVGGAFKLLFGLSSLNENFDRLTIEMTPSQWTVTSDVSLEGNMNGLQFRKNDKGNVVNFNYEGVKAGVCGVGFAFDAGVEYSPIECLDLSFSALNLGGISWKKGTALSASSSGKFTYKGFTDVTVNNSNIGKQAESIKEDFMAIASLKEANVSGNMFRGIGPTLIAGAEYSFLEDRLSAGLLFSESFSSIKNYPRLMASCNWRPFKSFELSGSFSFLDAGGKSIGLALNLFDYFFIACDHLFFRVTPQFLPLNTSTTSLQIGLNVPLSKNRRED